jgi:hypothetical protein
MDKDKFIVIDNDWEAGTLHNIGWMRPKWKPRLRPPKTLPDRQPPQANMQTKTKKQIDNLQRFMQTNVDDNLTQNMIMEALTWNDSLCDYIKHQNWEGAQILLDKSACVKATELYTERTPLHLACEGIVYREDVAAFGMWGEKENGI